MPWRTGANHQHAKHPTETVQMIRTQRERKGTSYDKLAKQYNIPAPTIRDWCEYRTRVSS